MAQSPESNDRPSIQQAAQKHAEEILARREVARATRKLALEKHPRPISIKTEVTRPEPISPKTEITQLDLSAAAAVPATTTRSAQTAGYLLAVGDSWFDYPIHDVLTKLDDTYGYNIESAAHKGDAIEAMVSRVGQLDKFARNVDKIADMGAVPKAILVSGGGNDIAGTEFGMLLNNVDLLIGDWNEQIVAGVIDTRIATAYRLMFATLNSICQKRLNHTCPILVHGYDYPTPDGRGFWGGWGPLPGPWLKPGFDEKLYLDVAANVPRMKQLIDRFNAMLQRIVKEPGAENVRYVDVRGTLSNAPAAYKDWWANELHPSGGGIFHTPTDGFAAVAAKFQAELTKLP